MQYSWGLPPDVVTQARAVFARYPQISRAVLFGSRAMGTHKPGSDIDIALFGKEELTLDLL